ncbi:hypothetical protein [Cryptosporangium arvum]|uniref:DUF304 domain-containing protein n=1 Tax=Cryptosporangium arvum DSM 44712 TaxID=927661 RepID=A0A010ZRJ5_9ACTN|nr:hypothetical protein [Cryptosporangium arvum]EXG79822.1 hypothetical protein CryarDRAFT_0868 [Cryptosporangium arvum DSM 44712]
MIRRAVLFELRIYRNLARWVARRPDVRGGEPFGYAQLVTPVLCLWIFGSAVETVVVHFILPWEGIRLVADIVGIWGLLWMLGLLAGMRTYPHLVTPQGLRVRHGGNFDLKLPWEIIASVTTQRTNLESSIRTLRLIDDELFVAVNNEVNVRVVLTEPIIVKDREVTAVSFLADDPKALVARAKAPATP